jgi:hypothetical protein
MPRFAEVKHTVWIAAPQERVRHQFADLQHHIATTVHPKLRFEVIEQSARGARFVQYVKLLGFTQRDVFVRAFPPDGSMVDTSVEGFNRGGSLRFVFRPDGAGTAVDITIRLPLPPFVGALLKPLLERQVRKEVSAAADEDKYDIEVRGYPRALAA